MITHTVLSKKNERLIQLSDRLKNTTVLKKMVKIGVSEPKKLKEI